MVKCLVCGNRSSGVHYGVESCEGCKAFYKRGLLRTVEYKCYFGQSCTVEGSLGYRCKACRFRKCVELGMDPRAPKRHRRTKEAMQAQLLAEKAKSQEHAEDSPTETSLCDTSRTVAADGNENAALNKRTKPLPDVDDDHEGQVSLGSLVTFRKTSPASVVPSDTIILTRKVFMEPTVQRQVEAYDFANLPPFLRDYWTAVRKRGFLVDNTIRSVADALQQAYGELFTLWDSFMTEVQLRRSVPPQPDLTLELMVKHVRDGFTRFIQSSCRFMMLLPGFSDLDQSDQSVLLMEKFSETWLMCHGPYMRDGEFHILIGPDWNIHCSLYWLRQILETDHYNVLLTFAADLNSINLTHLEHFILLAVAVFQPEYTTAENKTFLTFLNAHYMDCLLRSIRSRCTGQEQIVTEKRLQNFMRHFRSLYRMGNFYVRRMNYDRAPFKAINGNGVITVTEALSKEDDGLQPIQENLAYLLA